MLDSEIRLGYRYKLAFDVGQIGDFVTLLMAGTTVKVEGVRRTVPKMQDSCTLDSFSVRPERDSLWVKVPDTVAAKTFALKGGYWFSECVDADFPELRAEFEVVRL